MTDAKTNQAPQTGASKSGATKAKATKAPATGDRDKDNKSEVQTREVRGIEVKGPPQGRWRIGRWFGPDAVFLTEEEVGSEKSAKALENDPLLSIRPAVREVPVEPEID